MTKIKVVIGANFGDEGKGLMSDYFAGNAQKALEKTIVVLSNGGAQRGHTVETPAGVRHVFHHFGSGTLKGAASYFPKEYILNPMMFLAEYEECKALGVTPECLVNRECMVTTPFDMMVNQILEESRGENRHGSCGMGIWETIVRNGKRVGELYSMSRPELYEYVKEIRDEYLPGRLAEMGVWDIPEAWKKILQDDGIIEQFTEDFFYMMKLIFRKTDDFSKDACLKGYDTVIFENGQGLLLDQNRKEYGDHTTPSNTGMCNPKRIIDEVFATEERKVEVCYVTRTYMTRHGAGQFETQCDVKEINENIVDLTNIPNPHQGTIRFGKLILQDLVERITKDFQKDYVDGAELSIAITHLNEYGLDMELFKNQITKIRVPLLRIYKSDRPDFVKYLFP